MSTERDIIIERLEQKLAARDKEFAKMQESLRESILIEMEKRFADKIKLRESTLDEIKMKFTEKVNEIIEMNKSLRDSLVDQRKSEAVIQEAEKRMDRIERRLVELNSSYDGVMKELLDQKSILQGLLPKTPEKEKKKPEEKPREEARPPEKPKPKGEYIIAENYKPDERKKKQVFIEADETNIAAEDDPVDDGPRSSTLVKRSERLREGVEIFEAPRKR